MKSGFNKGIALLITGLALSAGPVLATSDEVAAKDSVLKVLKDPASAKFGKFTAVGTKWACLTVYAKSPSGYVGTQEAFLQKSDGRWAALYVADIATGHEGCVKELAAR